MSPFLPILVVGGGELWLATLLPEWIGWFWGWAGASTTWAGVAYAVNRPGLLGKTHAPRLAAALLWPYLAFSRGVARAARKGGLVERVEVAPGLWVGAWPSRGDCRLAHLDLTAELPRRANPARYRNIPMLDGAAPDPAAYHAAVEQVLAWRAEGLEVLVHCAYGHGRSVAVVVGALVRAGIEPDVARAHARVLAVRPRARMSAPQRALVARELGDAR